MNDKQNAKKAQEEDSLHELMFSKLDAMWNDVKFMKKLSTRMSELESDKVVLWCLYAFSAAKGAELGQTKEEFLESVGQAFDDTSDDEDEDDLSSNEELEEEGVDEETERMNLEAEPEHSDDSEAAHTEEE